MIRKNKTGYAKKTKIPQHAWVEARIIGDRIREKLIGAAETMAATAQQIVRILAVDRSPVKEDFRELGV